MVTTPVVKPPRTRKQQILDNTKTWVLSTVCCLIVLGALLYFTGALSIAIHSYPLSSLLRLGLTLLIIYMVFSVPMMMGGGMEMDEYAYRKRLEHAMQYFLHKETINHDVNILGNCVDELLAQKNASITKTVANRMVIDLAVKKAQGL